MLNYYHNHYWCCPICKKRFNLEHNSDINNNIKHKSIKEFNRKKDNNIDGNELPQEIKSSSISMFPSKGRGKIMYIIHL